MSKIIFRAAKKTDAKELLEIYAPYVKETAITFEYDVPSLDDFENRIVTISKSYPYIVAIIDGQIVAYAYGSIFHERKAYERSTELSIYVKQDFRGQKIGSKIYDELEKQLKERQFTALYACIAASPRENDLYLTNASIKFHENRGYKLAGTFTRCAYKFGLWYNMVYYEKHLDE